MGRHSAPGKTPAGRAPAADRSAEPAGRQACTPQEPAPDLRAAAGPTSDLDAAPPAPPAPVPDPPDVGALSAPGIEVLAWTAFAAVIAWVIIAAAGHDLSDATDWALGVALLVPVALLVRAPAWLRERRARRGDQ